MGNIYNDLHIAYCDMKLKKTSICNEINDLIAKRQQLEEDLARIEYILTEYKAESEGQETILNQIKEEIRDKTYFINEINEKEGIDFETVEKIIDKYKAESEG